MPWLTVALVGDIDTSSCGIVVVLVDVLVEVDDDVLVEVEVDVLVLVDDVDNTVSADTLSPPFEPYVSALSSTCTAIESEPVVVAVMVHVVSVGVHPVDTTWLPMLHVYAYGGVPPVAIAL